MRELFRRLKNEGFLNKRPGTALSLVKTAEQQSIQQRAYFNPMTYIDHQVCNLHVVEYTVANHVSMSQHQLLRAQPIKQKAKTHDASV